MKLTQVIAELIAVTAVSSVVAAPVESMETGRAAAQAKVQGFLAEKVVSDQLKSLGLTTEQVNARLALASDTQIEQLATQVDLIRTGGDIQTDNTGGGAFGAFFKQLGDFFYALFHTIFFWRK